MSGADASPGRFDKQHLTQLFCCLSGFRSVALAVSGGSDSMALMALVRDWLLDAQPAPQVSVLSVDHGLRPGSANEAKQVCKIAQKWGFSAEVLTWQGAKPETAIQDQAREARYDLMTSWCKAQGCDVLVTAHTLEDQAETMLMRLARGSGLEGLGGMRRKVRRSGIEIARPMLSEKREDLRAFLKDRSIDWIDDPSNEDMRFERVRMRRLSGLLEREGIGVDALALSAKRLDRANESVVRFTNDALARICEAFPAGYAKIDGEDFADLPDEIAVRIAGIVCSWAGGWQGWPRLSRVEGVVEWMQSGDGRARTISGARIVRHRDGFLVGREAGRILPVELSGKETSVEWDNRFELTFDKPAVRVEACGDLIAEKRISRIEDVPYFVAAALPCVTLENGEIVAVSGEGSGPVRGRLLSSPIDTVRVF